MKNIRLLLICSFILLLFSANAVATLSTGTYSLDDGEWEGFLTTDPPIINAWSLTSGNWSIADMEQVDLILPSEWVFVPGTTSQPPEIYGEVIETHENGTFTFQLDGISYDDITINSILRWTLHLVYNGSEFVLGYGTDYFSFLTGSLNVDGTEYNLFIRLQGEETYRDPNMAEGTVDSLILFIVEQFSPDQQVVNIDIKPNSCPNSLNADPKGILTVAVLGTQDFDVNDIDPTSVSLEGVPSIRSSVKDVATPNLDLQPICEWNSEGEDGFDDLILKFTARDIIEKFGEVQAGNIFLLTLEGTLTDGTTIGGMDFIVIVKKGNRD
jgi:hypothetical protein